MSLKRNLFRNGVATGLQKVVQILEQVLLVPFFISAWGVAYYGEWITLTIIPTVLAFSDLGFGTSAANRFVLLYASGDRKAAANVSKSGFFVIGLIVAGSLTLSAILIFVLKANGVFTKSLIPASDAILAVSILMLARILNFYQQLFIGYFIAARRVVHSTYLFVGYAAINLIASLVVLVNDGNIVAFASSNLLISVLFNIYYAWNAKKVLPIQKEFKGRIYRSDIGEIAKKGLGYLMTPVWQAIFFQGTTLVVRATLGPSYVALFNTVRTVTRSVNQVFNMVNTVLFPEIQYLIGSDQVQKARRLFRIALCGVTLSSLIGILLLSLFGQRAYEMWTQSELAPPSLMWNIFLVGILFNALWWTGSVVFRAANKPIGISSMGVVSALISVFASYALSLEFGLIGVAWGCLLMEVVMAFYVLPNCCKILNQSLSTLFKDIYFDILHLLRKEEKIAKL